MDRDQLQKSYDEQLESFEKWKIENSMQKGSTDYNKYITDFKAWQHEMLKNINALAAQERSHGPANVDSMLDELLDEVSFPQFVQAMMMMHLQHPSFVSNMLGVLQTLKDADNQPRLVVPQAVQPTQAYMQAQFASASSMNVPSSAQWMTPIVKGFRASSPVKDYKNPNSTMPFLDFSQ